MGKVVDIEKRKSANRIKKAFRNWVSGFKEDFSEDTRICDLSYSTLSYLARAKDDAPFYMYDLIMNLLDMGSGFEFYELSRDKKLFVMDCYLYLLDRIRFELMKRLGWIEEYPGEDMTIVQLITIFKGMETTVYSTLPVLSREHPDYQRFLRMNEFEKEEFIRRLIPRALKKIDSYSTTL